MHIFQIVVLIVFYSVSYSQESAPVLTPSDFTGHYQFSWEPNEQLAQMKNEFPRFVQFDILDPGSTGRISRMKIAVYFFSSSGGAEDDSLIRCYQTRHFITRDSLYFSTLQCSSERYEFKGHFLTRIGEETPPTIQIEGILSYYRGSTLREKAHVQFSWIAGC
jgi:hypothetical protein